MNHLKKSAFLAQIAFFCVTAAQANQSGPDLSVDARVGYLSDSNVNVTQLDTNTGSDDAALDLELGVAAKLPVTERLKLNLGYGFSSVRYETFDEFNLALHQLRGSLDYRIAGFDTSIAAEQYIADLDNDRFLDVRQATPSVGRLFAERLYLRAAWTLAEKDYDQNPERDATNQAARLDAYVLLDGMDSFLSFGYVSDSENAFDDAFDYDGTRLSVGAGQRIGEGTRSLMLRARAHYDQRDYTGITPSIETERSDQRFRADVTATLGLNEALSLEGKIGYADNASNLDAANFDELVYGVSVGVSF